MNSTPPGGNKPKRTPCCSLRTIHICPRNRATQSRVCSEIAIHDDGPVGGAKIARSPDTHCSRSPVLSQWGASLFAMLLIGLVMVACRGDDSSESGGDRDGTRQEERENRYATTPTPVPATEAPTPTSTPTTTPSLPSSPRHLRLGYRCPGRYFSSSQPRLYPPLRTPTAKLWLPCTTLQVVNSG